MFFDRSFDAKSLGPSSFRPTKLRFLSTPRNFDHKFKKIRKKKKRSRKDSKFSIVPFPLIDSLDIGTLYPVETKLNFDLTES